MAQRLGDPIGRGGEWARPTRDPQAWLFLAGDGRSVAPHRDTVLHLGRVGHRVTVAFATGPHPRGLSGIERHRLSAALRVPSRVRPPVQAVLRRLSVQRQLRSAITLDPWLGARSDGVDHIVTLDEPAAEVTTLLRRRLPRAELWHSEQLPGLLEEEAHWRYLDHRLRRLAGLDEHTARYPLKGLAGAVDWLATRPRHHLRAQSDLGPHARSLAHTLMRRGRYGGARTVLQAATLAAGAHPRGTAEAATLRALETSLRLDEGTTPDHTGLLELLGQVFAEADAALTEGDVATAAGRAAAGLELMFSPRLHTDTASTPLVDDPESWVRPFARSVTGQRLGAPVPHRAGARTAPDTTPEDRTRVLVLPGSYPWHAEPLLEELRAHDGADLTELTLDPGHLAGMAVSASFLEYRLRRQLEPGTVWPAGVPTDADELLGAADVVVADWADRGAAWVSTALPPGPRLVLRVHSVDLLSPALHLVDWSRVDDAVLVGPHMEDIFRGILGDRVARVRTHVVPNLLPERPLQPAPEDGHLLAMVGWGKKVKDPLLALDVLALLRSRDPAYRLRLIGAPLSRSRVPVVDDYTVRFRQRLTDPDLAGAVEQVGQTEDVAAQLAGVAFVLSTSLRESFHIGAMEGVQAGALPVVREWPAYARYRGASRIFPERCVVTTVEEAVDLIWSLRAPEVRVPEVASIQRELAGVLEGQEAGRALLRVILG